MRMQEDCCLAECCRVVHCHGRVKKSCALRMKGSVASKLSSKDCQSDTALLSLLLSPSFAIPLLLENNPYAMAPNFFKNNLINHVYHLMNEKAEVYDEEYSVKAVLDEASSDTSSTETLLAKRESFYHYKYCHGIILIFNIALFCLSLTLFGISGYRLMKPDDPFDNGILRKSSEYCEWSSQGMIVGG